MDRSWLFGAFAPASAGACHQARREGLPGAWHVIRVAVDHVFPNCPRYIPSMEMQGVSEFAPAEGQTPPKPAWKSRPMVKDIFQREAGWRGGDDDAGP